MSDSFTSKYAVDPKGGYDAGNLKDKSVVVTGGASGMGEEFVRHFVKAGAFVTIGDLSGDLGKQIVSELGEDKTVFVKCDVLIWSDQVNLFKTAVSRSPNKTVDIVIANAGISGNDTVWRDDAGDNDEPVEPDLKILKIDMIGVVYTVKLAVHYLARNGEGNDRVLIMTSSIAGYVDQPGSPQYCASKWGVRGLMRSLRRTMPAMGMRVNIIAPWFVKTRILSQEGVDKAKAKGIKFAEKADAATAVLHFASNRSINGRSLMITSRDVSPQGYLDLQEDDNEEGDFLTEFQNLAMKASHRMGG